MSQKFLPPSYTRLKCIRMNHGYIDTNIFGNQDSRIILTSKCEELINNTSLVTDQSGTIYFGAGGMNLYYYYQSFNKRESFRDSISKFEKRTFDISKKGFYIDDIKKIDFSTISDFTSNKPFRFGAYDCDCTIWEVTFYNKDKQIADFIPVMSQQDGVIGMYDLVGQEFYISPNGSAFTTGQE